MAGLLSRDQGSILAGVWGFVVRRKKAVIGTPEGVPFRFWGVDCGGSEEGWFALLREYPTHAMKPHEWGTRVYWWVLCMGHPPSRKEDISSEEMRRRFGAMMKQGGAK
jgi:hypothetical protein